jgi:hypothetical protein
MDLVPYNHEVLPNWEDIREVEGFQGNRDADLNWADEYTHKWRTF